MSNSFLIYLFTFFIFIIISFFSFYFPGASKMRIDGEDTSTNTRNTRNTNENITVIQKNDTSTRNIDEIILEFIQESNVCYSHTFENYL